MRGFSSRCVIKTVQWGCLWCELLWTRRQKDGKFNSPGVKKGLNKLLVVLLKFLWLKPFSNDFNPTGLSFFVCIIRYENKPFYKICLKDECWMKKQVSASTNDVIVSLTSPINLITILIIENCQSSRNALHVR